MWRLSSISNSERGTRRLHEDQIIELVKAFDTTADYFLGLLETNKKGQN